MPILVNNVKMRVATGGTGPIELGVADEGHQSFADAGVVDGQQVVYGIVDGSQWENGVLTYVASNNSITRSVSESSNADNPINVTLDARVFSTARAQDLSQTGHGHTWDDISTAEVNVWDSLRLQTSSGYIDFGPANASYAHIYTDRPAFYLNKPIEILGSQVLTTANEGSGNGIDADSVDGVHAEQFLRADVPDFISSDLTVSTVGSLAYDLLGSGNLNGAYIPYPEGAVLDLNDGAAVGAIEIKLPLTAAGSVDMVKFWVDVYQYNSDKTFSVQISGYCNTAPGGGNVWVNETATIIGRHPDTDYTVRFGDDGTNPCIWIGEVNTIWGYPKVIVRDLHAAHAAAEANWVKGWSIGLATSFGTVERTSAGNFVLAKSAAELDAGNERIVPTASGLSFYTNNAFAALLDAAGKLGIGTTPSFPLHVETGLDITGLFESTDGTNSVVIADSTGSVAITTSSAGDMRLRTGGGASQSGGFSDAVTIKADGSVEVVGTVDGRDIAADGTKLDGIETGATADQTKADIDALGINAAETGGLTSTQLRQQIVGTQLTSSDDIDSLPNDGSYSWAGVLPINAPFSYMALLQISDAGQPIQFAFGTASANARAMVRRRNNGTWGTWSEFLNTDSYNAADVLAKLITVDGAGSDLDADLLDGLEATAFATASQGTKADAALDSTTFLSARGIGDANGANTRGISVNYLTGAAINEPVGTDHALLTLSYSTNWSYQLAGDWRTGNLYVRNQENGTWEDWHQVWTDSDFANNSGNWNTAYSWGDHAAAGYAAASHTHAPADIDGITENANGDLRLTTAHGYIEWGPKNATYAHIYTDRGAFYFNKQIQVLGSQVWHRGDFGSTDVTNWNTAYGWGNHASAGYAELTGANFTGDVSITSVGPSTLSIIADTDNVNENDVAKLILSQDGALVTGEVSLTPDNNMLVENKYSTGDLLLRATNGDVFINGTNVFDNSGNLSVAGNVAVTGTVDGRDVAADGVVLDDLLADSKRIVSVLNAMANATPTNGMKIKTGIAVGGNSMVQLRITYGGQTYLDQGWMSLGWYDYQGAVYQPRAFHFNTGAYPTVEVGAEDGKFVIFMNHTPYFGYVHVELLRNVDGPGGASYAPTEADIEGWSLVDEAKSGSPTYAYVTAASDNAWTNLNDGPASGLHADLLDDQHGAFYLARGNHTGTQAQSTITNLVSDLVAKAPLASPALTGTPTAPTAAGGTNTTQLATTAFVQATVAALIDGAPGAIDTLNELAAALGDDPNFASTVTNALALKQAILAEGAFVNGDKTKLDGIASGATANDTDANLKNRANHTGSQAISTVTGLQTALDGKATSAQGVKADTALQPVGAVTLTGGFDSDEEAIGTVTSGTVTPEVDALGKENFKTLTNNGAFTLAPPSTSSATTIRIRVINGASAGAITTTGFDAVFDPDEYATTDAKEYWFYIDHDSARSTLTIREIV